MVNTRVVMDGPKDAGTLLVLAPGSGQAVDDPGLEQLAAYAGGQGVAVVRFEFAYMRARRLGATQREPDPDPVLAHQLVEAVRQHRGPGQQVVIGGWSRGARIATRVAERCGAAGLVGVSYPFHPKGQPACQGRVDALHRLSLPTLIIQGTRDAFGNRERIRGYRLPEHIRVRWIEDANHNLEPRPGSPQSHAQCLDQAAAELSLFVLRVGG